MSIKVLKKSFLIEFLMAPLTNFYRRITEDVVILFNLVITLKNLR